MIEVTNILSITYQQPINEHAGKTDSNADRRPVSKSTWHFVGWNWGICLRMRSKTSMYTVLNKVVGLTRQDALGSGQQRS